MGDPQDQVFKALADSSRRQILSALCNKSMVAGELGRLVSLAPNAVSVHLKLLHEAGLVSVRRQGRYIWYQVEPKTLEEWQAHAHGLFANPGNAHTFDLHLSKPPAYKPAGRRTPSHDQTTRGADPAAPAGFAVASAPVGPSETRTPSHDQTPPAIQPPGSPSAPAEATITPPPESEDRLPSELL
jgi:ArsR family transcriptional regulator